MTIRDNRKAALAQIHIAEKQLGMDRETYRAMLKTVTGKDSCAAMSLMELHKVIHHLRRVGFKPKPRGRVSPKAQGKIVDVMRAIWIQMHQVGMVRDGSETALAHWAKRASSQRNGGIGVDSLEWLEKDHRLASQVLEDLKQWRKRVARQWFRDDTTLIQQVATDHPELAVKQIVQDLLAHHRIMFWPQFEDLGLENMPTYCTNREELKRG